MDSQPESSSVLCLVLTRGRALEKRTETEHCITKDCEVVCVALQKLHTKYKRTNIKFLYTVGLEHIQTPSGSVYRFNLK